MTGEEARNLMSEYRLLRDKQMAACERCAKRHGVNARDLSVLGIIWSSPEGCLQSDICTRLSVSRQTISAIIKKFRKRGYLSMTESEGDLRNKIIRFTETGREYAEKVVAPAMEAEVRAMAVLSTEEAETLIRMTSMFAGYAEEELDAVRKEKP
ncbi:MAG: MarR family transcriptional regulator [Oscillospiraceae bacterium]|jgi:DNA-binding MarR family transcriptional regulator|nr:MarR family transcriptional regulator [Oscillospiraceae bacterium]